MSRAPESNLEYESMDLFSILHLLWNRKWLIAGATLLSVGLSLVYIRTAKQWFRADVFLKPSDIRTSLGASGQLGSLGSLGGLASLAGIGGAGSASAEPLAVLSSREFTRAFIEEQNLLPVLYASRWDSVAHRWKSSVFSKPPDIRDAVDLFNKSIRTVQEDKRTGFVTMSIEWTDPDQAANWANLLVEKLNAYMRSRALAEADTNVTYLKQELATANVVTLQQAIGRVLESELQRLMLATATREYSFKIIDHAIPPKRHSWPRGTIIAPLAFFLGLGASVFYVLAIPVIRRESGSRAG